MITPWTFPLNGTNYICWRDKDNQPRNRPMSREEENTYFSSKEPEKYLNELLNS